MSGRVNLVAAGFALTALTYGLARFAYGLLLPAIREDLAMSATAAGWVGASAFAAYCIGIVLSLGVGARLGERRTAGLAALAATGGLAVVAFAQAPASLGLGIALGGLSTGLTSPPLATAVMRCVHGPSRASANAVINAGTAAGIVLSGVAVIAYGGAWRALYAGFAGMGAVVMLWLWFALPAGRPARTGGGLSWAMLGRPGLGGLCTSAFLMGGASTAIWTFGATILRTELGLDDAAIARGWIVLGAGGLAGMGTGLLTRRLGIGVIHRLALGGMALVLGGLAAATVVPAWHLALMGLMGLFGAAYIVSTGTFLLWGIAHFADRPDVGLGLPFLTIAVGQTAGAPLFGFLGDTVGNVFALMAFAALMAGAGIWAQQTPAVRLPARCRQGA